MSSVGGFRKGEIDGKSFLIFTFSNQPENPSSSSSSFSNEITTVSGDSNELLQPLFICPNLRDQAEYIKLKENGYDGDASDASVLIPSTISPHFPTKTSGDQHVQYLLDSDGNVDFDSDYNGKSKICKLPLLPLFWCNNQDPARYEFRCDACETYRRGTNYYFCVTCDEIYHKECVESPFQIKHPSYPFFSLRLSYSMETLKCCCCTTVIGNIGYHSPTSRFGYHPVCVMEPIPFVIDHPKRHPHHPLTFFPKQDSLACNVCGLIEEHIPTYVCVPCLSLVHQFVVHQDCVDSPNVIKISRHYHHRISFTSSLPYGEWFCGVCRKEVDNRYGAYSCNQCNGYFVHIRCALRRDLWDGKELEGVPEKDEIVVPPFKRIANGIILHFSHGHHLKVEINRVYDEDKFCSTCILPIIFEDEFYSCVDQCDFILHKACANAPRKMRHPLHAHPLTLNDQLCYFTCSACWHICCGFVYESNHGGFMGFGLDLRCALVSEPFKYQGHEHPLFLALAPDDERAAVCQICQVAREYVRKLNCIKCNFVICFKCATLPYKAWYKHDRHLLTFHKDKEESDEFGWCESCEEKIVYSEKGGFYSCDDYCGTTLHVDCLLGRDPYIRHGQTSMYYGVQMHIVRNNTMSRPFCERNLKGKQEFF